MVPTLGRGSLRASNAHTEKGHEPCPVCTGRVSVVPQHAQERPHYGGIRIRRPHSGRHEPAVTRTRRRTPLPRSSAPRHDTGSGKAAHNPAHSPATAAHGFSASKKRALTSPSALHKGKTRFLYLCDRLAGVFADLRAAYTGASSPGCHPAVFWGPRWPLFRARCIQPCSERACNVR